MTDQPPAPADTPIDEPPEIDDSTIDQPRPVAASERIASLDVLRGVAVLGILIMNLDGFALLHYGPQTESDAKPANLVAWCVTDLLFEGTMRGIFSLLFGAGVILLTMRPGKTDEVADIYYRRTIWLIIFGAIHAYILLWPGDILYAYGMAALFLFPLRRLKPVTLIALGVLALATMVPRGLGELRGAEAKRDAAIEATALRDGGDELTEEQAEAIETWEKELGEHDGTRPERDMIAIMRSGYLTIFTSAVPRIVEGHTSDLYKWDFWDSIGVMLIGMGLMKLRIFTAERSLRFYVTFMVSAYAVGLTVNTAELWWLFRHDFELIAMHQSWITYDLGRMTMSLGHVGLVLTIFKLGRLPRLTARLAAAGRMALTNYIMQTVICVLVFYGVGLGLYDRFERWQLPLFLLLVWSFQLLVSPWWLNRFRFGPLEWLWRSLTYWKVQRLRAARD